MSGADAPPGALFAYGTLLPGEPRWRFLEPFAAGDPVADAVDGTLFDTGRGYPAARFGTGGRIHGGVVPLVADRLAEALEVLDGIEGAVAGLYHRVQLVTVGGRSAWAYQYGGGLDLVEIASGSWQAAVTRAPRRGPGPTAR